MDKDRELVQKILSGDDKAFNDLVRQYQKIIYWQCRRMLGSHLDADEVTQQVIIVIYKKLSTFKFNSSLKTWIYKITQTRCLNFLKKKNLRQFFSITDNESLNLSSDNDIITNLEDKEKINKLNEILEEIPIKQRQVFVLRHFDELSYDEIAEITGKSVGGLKANYFHASKKIIERMSNEG